MTRPEFPKVPLNLVRRDAPGVAKVISNDLCMKGKSASFVRHLVLDISGTLLEGNFAAGQSFGVIAPSGDTESKDSKTRLYSIASPSFGEDGQGKWISTTPKRLIDEYWGSNKDDKPDSHKLFVGVCSNYLCDLQPGDEVRITGPSGRRFVLPTNPEHHDYVFLATGTGIAPFRGMLLELLANSEKAPIRSRIDLVMGAPYTTDLLYDDLFCRLETEHENFHYHRAISREATAASGRGLYIDSFIEQHMDTFAPVLRNERTLLYACGLAAMRYSVTRLLASHGLSEGYFRVAEPILSVPVAQWRDPEIRKFVKPGDRCFLEVY